MEDPMNSDSWRGWIERDGTASSNEEMEQKLLSAVSGRQRHLREAFSMLARFYKAIDRAEDCETCLDRVVELTEEPNAKSGLLLQLGVAAERRQDWQAGGRYYERSLAAEPTGRSRDLAS